MAVTIPVGRLQVATPETMALSIRSNTEATEAVDERIQDVAVDIITDNPTVVAATAAAVEAELASKAVGYTLLRRGRTQGFFIPVRGAVAYSPTGGPFGTGAVKRAVSGTASVVSLANAVPEPSGEVTITVWVRLDSIPASQNRVAVAVGGTRVYVGAATGTGNLIFSAADAAFTTSVPIADGAWHFVEGAFSRISGVTRPVALHVDGAAVTLPVAQSSQAWDASLSVLGFNSALSQFDWPGEVGNFEIFTDQRTSFGVPDEPNNGGGRTLALAQLADSLVDLGSVAYDPRPAGAPPGSCRYKGWPTPDTWLPRDEWVQKR